MRILIRRYGASSARSACVTVGTEPAVSIESPGQSELLAPPAAPPRPGTE
jgi:hypothetical protein